MIEEIYAERILDHYRNPRNYGKLKNYDVRAKEVNIPCGDEIEVFVKLKGNKIKEMKFVGNGCAISQAAASILSEVVKGMTKKEIEKMSYEDFIKKHLKIDITYRRFGCATLALRTLKKALVSK